jgi:hypothetical protein
MVSKMGGKITVQYNGRTLRCDRFIDWNGIGGVIPETQQTKPGYDQREFGYGASLYPQITIYLFGIHPLFRPMTPWFGTAIC